MKYDAVQELRDEIKRLEEKNGAVENPFVEGLRAQLSRLEKMKPGQHAPNPMSMGGPRSGANRSS